jgi:hypothetical protein
LPGPDGAVLLKVLEDIREAEPHDFADLEVRDAASRHPILDGAHIYLEIIG